MALVEIKCPECGGTLEMDDTMEKGFCMYCGSVVHISEEMKKGHAEPDENAETESKEEKDVSVKDSILLAKKSFDAGNFADAYDYYSKQLESDKKNWQAVFRKGLCAANIDIERSEELVVAIDGAISLLDKESGNTLKDKLTVFDEALGFAIRADAAHCPSDKNTVFEEIDEVNAFFDAAYYITMIVKKCADIITEEMMEDHPETEPKRKAALSLGIDIAEKGLRTISYISGYRNVVKNNRNVSEPVKSRAVSSYRDTEESYSQTMKNEYNNLPSIRAAISNYDSEIDRLSGRISYYNGRLNEYLINNPTLNSAYHKKYGLLYFLGAGVGLVAAIVLFFLNHKVWAAIVLAAAVILGVAGLVFEIKGASIRKKILEEMPNELRKLKKENDRNLKELKQTGKKKKKYIKTNTKR